MLVWKGRILFSSFVFSPQSIKMQQKKKYQSYIVF